MSNEEYQPANEIRSQLDAETTAHGSLWQSYSRRTSPTGWLRRQEHITRAITSSPSSLVGGAGAQGASLSSSESRSGEETSV